jgi:hypothetical protein
MFLDVFYISTGGFVKVHPEVTKNVIGVRSAATRPCHVLAPRSIDHLISNGNHNVSLMFNIHTILCAEALYPIANQREHTHLSSRSQHTDKPGTMVHHEPLNQHLGCGPRNHGLGPHYFQQKSNCVILKMSLLHFNP